MSDPSFNQFHCSQYQRIQNALTDIHHMLSMIFDSTHLKDRLDFHFSKPKLDSYVITSGLYYLISPTVMPSQLRCKAMSLALLSFSFTRNINLKCLYLLQSCCQKYLDIKLWYISCITSPWLTSLEALYLKKVFLLKTKLNLFTV